jgi:hypothetical protein
VPFRSQAYAIKGLLLDRGVSLLGIRFVSPAELRELLAARSKMRLRCVSTLRLLLSVAAEECMRPSGRSTAYRKKECWKPTFSLRNPWRGRRTICFARSINSEPAGWDFSAVELPALREIATRFHRRLRDCGFELIHSC